MIHLVEGINRTIGNNKAFLYTNNALLLVNKELEKQQANQGILVTKTQMTLREYDQLENHLKG